MERKVRYDIYTPIVIDKSSSVNLLLVNDGQDLTSMKFKEVLAIFFEQGLLKNLICVGIHAGIERKQEYGVVGFPDYLKRGSRAGMYSSFILSELLPEIKQKVKFDGFAEKYFLGFSLGGLMALDIVLDNPSEFNAAAVFSGSFWWRSISLGEGYLEEKHRIMHAKIRTKSSVLTQKFFFQAGKLDEVVDRNNNGIIDSIDDTIDIIAELEKIGYQRGKQIFYYELEDGKHNLETWGRVLPQFLNWICSR